MYGCRSRAGEVRDPRLLALIDDLLKGPETATVEFKENNADATMVGRLVSALSNAARVQDREFAYVVWGVRDDDRTVVGTRFEPAAEPRQGQPYEFWLTQRLNPDTAISFKTARVDDRRVVLLEIPAATVAPVEFDRTAYIRIGSATPRLSDHVGMQRALWDKLRPDAWETGVADRFVEAGEVVELLDVGSYFHHIGRRAPDDHDALLDVLAEERLIARDVGGRWNVLNLGAILFARNLGTFAVSLGRKAVRFVAYDGDDRTSTVIHRWEFQKGYAVCLDAVNDYVATLVPSPEDNGLVVRRAKPLFPSVAMRELIANALIHQDMTVTGAGPMIELFRHRLEITNPGVPLIDTTRFIDAPPRSRNEALAALMRRMGFCEESGSGIDKVVDAVEAEHLPPPEFRADGDDTRVSLFGPRRFADLTTEERLRACYLHAGLTHLRGGRMRNSTLRQRFGVEARNAAQVSQVIRRALDRQLIRPADPERPRSGYVPFWA